MPTAADPEPARPPERTRTAGAAVLVVLLLLLTAGPVVADSLPSGPGGLLRPKSVAVGAPCVLILWAVFVWPLLARDRSPGTVTAQGSILLLVALPFLFGLALLAKVPPSRFPGIFSVLLLTLVAAGSYLCGPGRNRENDRWFAAGVVVVLFALPFANYALNEFGGVTGNVGYRVSPILLVRRFVLASASPELLPFGLVALLSIGLCGSLGRMRGTGAALAFLLLCGTASAQGIRVEPVLGDAYVPGRAVPLRVVGVRSGEMFWIRSPGGGRHGARALPGGTVMLVPIPGRSARVEVRVGDTGGWTPVETGLRAVPEGSFWVVALAPVPDGGPEREGLVVTRAREQAGQLPPEAWLAADAVWRPQSGPLPEGMLLVPEAGVPILRRGTDLSAVAVHRGRSAGRRPWEETGSFSTLAGLEEVFPPDPDYDRDEAAQLLLVLGGFTLVCIASLRFFAARARPAVLLVLCVLTVPVVRAVVPPLGPIRRQVLEVRDGAHHFLLTRLRAEEAGVYGVAAGAGQLVLGPGDDAESAFGESPQLGVPLRKGQTRILVSRSVRRPTPPEGPPDLIIGPDGLSRPGEEPVAPVEFLRDSLRDANGRPTLAGIAVRRFLRLSVTDLPARRYGVRLPDADRRVFEIFPLTD